MNDKIELRYGLLCEPISKQLKDQGFDLPESDLKYFDRIKDALNCIMFSGFTTDSEYQKINLRVHKYITKKVQAWVKEQN